MLDELHMCTEQWWNDSEELYVPPFLSFYKYCPDNGLVRPKLVANLCLWDRASSW